VFQHRVSAECTAAAADGAGAGALVVVVVVVLLVVVVLVASCFHQMSHTSCTCKLALLAFHRTLARYKVPVNYKKRLVSTTWYKESEPERSAVYRCTDKQALLITH